MDESNGRLPPQGPERQPRIRQTPFESDLAVVGREAMPLMRGTVRIFKHGHCAEGRAAFLACRTIAGERRLQRDGMGGSRGPRGLAQCGFGNEPVPFWVYSGAAIPKHWIPKMPQRCLRIPTPAHVVDPDFFWRNHASVGFQVVVIVVPAPALKV